MLDVSTSGEGPPVILLHSLLQDRSSFAGVASRLSAERRVFNINMPGFGTSPKAQPLAGYADAIADAFDDMGIGPDADVIGNGLGGFVGLMLALRHGYRLRRLVLVGSAMRFPDAGRAAFRGMADKAEAAGMDSLVEQAMLRMFTAEYIDAHHDAVEPLREVFLSIRPDVFAAACRSLAELDLTDDLHRIQTPTLVVVGETDAATAASLGQALAEELPNGEVRVLKGMGHAPHLQDPEGFVSAIAPFLGLRA